MYTDQQSADGQPVPNCRGGIYCCVLREMLVSICQYLIDGGKATSNCKQTAWGMHRIRSERYGVTSDLQPISMISLRFKVAAVIRPVRRDLGTTALTTKYENFSEQPVFV